MREAVRHGITRSAGVVTSAAIVVVAVFSIFGTLSMFKHLGVGLAVAILVDAVLIRVGPPAPVAPVWPPQHVPWPPAERR